jgi:hypothetical protein
MLALQTICAGVWFSTKLAYSMDLPKSIKWTAGMYFETYTESEAAALREIQIKKYRREKKINLFAASNPEWRDISSEIRQSIGIPRFARDFKKP